MGDRYLIITAKFNELITNALLDGARAEFRERGVDADTVDEVFVPGCFEMPGAAARAAKSGRWNAIICLGAVIRGETPHFDYVAGEAARGLTQVSVDTGLPVIFGVLTTDTADQALARCGIKGGNKGRDAAAAAISMASLGRCLDGER